MIFVGDVHGDYTKTIGNIKRFDIKNETIIFCGDCGLYSEEDYKLLKALNDICKKTSNNMFFLRGNHDNPEFWNNKFKFRLLENLTFVGDYEVININNKNVLFVGGGISIDRKHNENGVSWWDNEPIDYTKDLSSISEPIDILVSHVPIKRILQHKLTRQVDIDYFIRNDKDLEDDLQTEQNFLEKLNEIIKPKMWISGHMHVSSLERNKGCKYKCLDIDEFFEV